LNRRPLVYFAAALWSFTSLFYLLLRRSAQQQAKRKSAALTL